MRSKSVTVICVELLTPALLPLTSPLSDLQVASGQVLLHVLLKGFLKELLPLFQLDLRGRESSLLCPRDPLCMLRVQLHWEKQREETVCKVGGSENMEN